MNLPIYQTIKMARIKFGHRYPEPEAAEESYHAWEANCTICNMRLVIHHFHYIVRIFFTVGETQTYAINTSTWDVYSAKERKIVICRKFQAFL